MTDNNEHNISPTLLAFDALLVCFIIAIFFIISGVIQGSNRQPAKVVEEPKVVTHVFDNLHIGAKAVYVYDISKGEVVYEKNSTAQLPLASLTKLMMALTAIKLVPTDSHITIRKEFLTEEGDTGLLANESWKLKDLLDFSLVVSSNDGARSIASVIGAMNLKTTDYDLGRKEFIEQMNKEAVELGLEQTYFVNESGLDVGETSGGYGSAEDVGKLLDYILKNEPKLLEATKYETTTLDSLTKAHVAKNTNVDIGQIPGLIASKTGYTALAGGNLAVAFDASIGRPFIVVVLGSTQEGRFKDVDSLVQATLKYVQE